MEKSSYFFVMHVIYAGNAGNLCYAGNFTWESSCPDFLFAYLEIEARPKWSLLLTLRVEPVETLHNDSSSYVL